MHSRAMRTEVDRPPGLPITAEVLASLDAEAADLTAALPELSAVPLTEPT